MTYRYLVFTLQRIKTMSVCYTFLFVLMIYVPVNNCSVMLGQFPVSWVEPVISCDKHDKSDLLKDTSSTVTPPAVGLKFATLRSPVPCSSNRATALDKLCNCYDHCNSFPSSSSSTVTATTTTASATVTAIVSVTATTAAYISLYYFIVSSG